VSVRGYPVYRIQAGDGAIVRVGSILEMRRSRRSMNRIALIRMAQRLFAGAPGEIVIVGSECLGEQAAAVESAVEARSAG